jgi:hypothetical protein
LSERRRLFKDLLKSRSPKSMEDGKPFLRIWNCYSGSQELKELHM